MKNIELVSLILNNGQKNCIYSESDIISDLRDCLDFAVASRDPDVIQIISRAQTNLREEL